MNKTLIILKPTLVTVKKDMFHRNKKVCVADEKYTVVDINREKDEIMILSNFYINNTRQRIIISINDVRFEEFNLTEYNKIK